MPVKTRYRFWHVLMVFSAFGIMAAIGYVSGDNQAELTAGDASPDKSAVRTILCFIFFVLFFYYSLNGYYRLVVARKKFIDFFKFSARIILVALVYHSFLFFYLPEALKKQYDSLPAMLCGSMSTILPLLLVSFLIVYVTNILEAVKHRRILEAQKLQLEMQISQANFNFLKAQINPHFLHNTLNFLYAKSLPHSAELSEGILTLNDIMRYALSQGNTKDDKVPLKDEVEHVNNVIKINQLRFSHQLQLDMSVNGSLNGIRIIPFVLITLVENAFKHGDLKNPEHPVRIRLDVTGNQLRFFCSNKKKSGYIPLSTGIGLENIKKRLELAYGDKYTFSIHNEPDFYTATLTIDML